MKPVTGLLYSQIGYDLGQPMRALVRGPEETLPSGATFTVVSAVDHTPILHGNVTFWGEIWGSAWWTADFSALNHEGEYVLVVHDSKGERFRSAPFAVGRNLLWNQTWRFSAIDANERRARLAREHVGWYDAGTAWQEANSHASLIVGLCDVLEFAGDRLPAADRAPLENQVLNGCDYLARLQDRAAELPGGQGAVVHQIWKFDELILPGDVSKAALAWTRAAQTLSDSHHEKKQAYLERAKRALNWIRSAKPLGGGKGFSIINHGLPADTVVPEEWPTRDLVIHLWAALELTLLGAEDCKQECAELANQILARQVTKDAPEAVYYGHFRTFASLRVTEKAWTHHGEGGYGADCGGTFPNYLLPLLKMREIWPDHPDAGRWEAAIRDFAYGYLLPACRANPFYLLPLGYFQDQGLLWFAGLWHGMNAAYGLTAALCMEFARYFGDDAFREIAVGNLQWIAGLNAGVTQESLFAAHMYSRDIPEGVALPCSMVQGIGTNQAGNWMQIRGSICNGFSVGDQFRFDVQPTAEVDGPHAFTDEDWITHAGGWLSGLVRL